MKKIRKSFPSAEFPKKGVRRKSRRKSFWAKPSVLTLDAVAPVDRLG